MSSTQKSTKRSFHQKQTGKESTSEEHKYKFRANTYQDKSLKNITSMYKDCFISLKPSFVKIEGTNENKLVIDMLVSYKRDDGSRMEVPYKIEDSQAIERVLERCGWVAKTGSIQEQPQ